MHMEHIEDHLFEAQIGIKTSKDLDFLQSHIGNAATRLMMMVQLIEEDSIPF